MKPPKVKQETPNTLDDKQSIQLLEYLDNTDTQHRVMIQLLIYLGLRREELLGLKWEDIDFDNSLISINRSIQYLPDKGIYESDTKATSLPYITAHSLRHTNATLSIANGMPLTTVAHRLGHANAGTTTKIYAHAIKSADEAAAEAINDLFTRKKHK